ncbi:hypothetical protein [uncultured Tateyamaria sp.]|uniref:hypothetical protein n=1 Tax=Tateyamaria sp. TaxID=1929288 RepID=UPI002625AAE2|nr:hypothetical protein [uncultured Tateyamaria sp.]
MRRTITITLHWLTLVLLLLLIAGGPTPILAWAFALAGLAQCAMALAMGLMNGPGPKLTGTLRNAHPWMSRAMYLALGIVSAATLAQLLGYTAPGPTLPELYFYLLSASALHGIFHLWRHTALGDGALRRITPKSMHGML